MARFYSLEDVVAINKAHPKTFEIPSSADRRAVQVGDTVKLVFKPTGKQDSERMWVNVTKVDAYGSYRGTLANDPIIVGIKYQDPVSFTDKHICDILKAGEKA